MEEKKMDRRIMNTKRALKKTLYLLMREKPVDAISPTELCRRADINRNTFYSHYYSARELLESIENELFEQIVSSMNGNIMKESVHELLRRVCAALQERREDCEALFSQNGDSVFLDRLMELGRGWMIAEWAKRGIRAPETDNKLFYAYLSGGAASVLRAWVSTGMEQSPDAVASLIEKVCMGSVREIGKF